MKRGENAGVYEREDGARDAVKQKMRNILRYWVRKLH